MSEERRDLVVTRVFDAPVERVWKAWTDPDDVKQWWGPAGFTAPVARMDFREGGTSLVAMRTPDGIDLYNTWTYEEIVPMDRVVFLQCFSDEEGTAVDPSAQGLPAGTPREIRSEVTFRDVDGRTEVTVTEFDWPVGQMAEMSKMGLEQTLDKMASVVAAGP
jgi:uncharacterized protein YndB with AHSA1/START domain